MFETYDSLGRSKWENPAFDFAVSPLAQQDQSQSSLWLDDHIFAFYGRDYGLVDRVEEMVHWVSPHYSPGQLQIDGSNFCGYPDLLYCSTPASDFVRSSLDEQGQSQNQLGYSFRIVVAPFQQSCSFVWLIQEADVYQSTLYVGSEAMLTCS